MRGGREETVYVAVIDWSVRLLTVARWLAGWLFQLTTICFAARSLRLCTGCADNCILCRLHGWVTGWLVELLPLTRRRTAPDIKRDIYLWLSSFKSVLYRRPPRSSQLVACVSVWHSSCPGCLMKRLFYMLLFL